MIDLIRVCMPRAEKYTVCGSAWDFPPVFSTYPLYPKFSHVRELVGGEHEKKIRIEKNQKTFSKIYFEVDRKKIIFFEHFFEKLKMLAENQNFEKSKMVIFEKFRFFKNQHFHFSKNYFSKKYILIFQKICHFDHECMSVFHFFVLSSPKFVCPRDKISSSLVKIHRRAARTVSVTV